MGDAGLEVRRSIHLELDLSGSKFYGEARESQMMGSLRWETWGERRK